MQPNNFANILGYQSKKTRDKCPPHLKPALRRRWWNDKNEGTCFCCGRVLHYDDSDAGHIKAYIHGGEWSPENCRLICKQCNSGMRANNMKTYMKKYYPERFKQAFNEDVEKDNEKIITKTKKSKKKKQFSSNGWAFPSSNQIQRNFRRILGG